MWSLHRKSQEWLDYVKSIHFNYDAEIIEICENRNISASREKYWGQIYKDAGEAEYYFEDLRGDKNPSKKQENKDKISKSRRELYKNKYKNYANSFTPDEELTKIRNTGRNRKIVQQISNGKIIAEYESIAVASKAVGVDRSIISRACSNGRM